MPYDSTDALPSAVKKLPANKQKQFMNIVNSALKNGKSEQDAFKMAWGVVKKAMLEIINKSKSINNVEFGAYFTKASLDNNGKMLWNATASDTFADSYDEEMSIGLYKSFINYINQQINTPVYVSLSHYPRLNGKGEVGVVTDLYIEGNKLKAKGYFKDTPLGVSVYNAVRKDRRDNISPSDRVRISIGFYDRKHSHANGNIWEFKSLQPCLDCAKGVGGKTYLEGILEHLAVTRVPVNKRTDIVAKSESDNNDMTTRYQDAASIVTDTELVDEVEKALQEEMHGKSNSGDELITKGEIQTKIFTDLAGLPNNTLLKLFHKLNDDGTLTDDELSSAVNVILNEITPSSMATDIKSKVEKPDMKNKSKTEVVNKGVMATEGESSATPDFTPGVDGTDTGVSYAKQVMGNFPVDSPALVGAAWSWFLAIRDGDEFTAEALTEIETLIREAWNEVGQGNPFPYERTLDNDGDEGGVGGGRGNALPSSLTGATAAKSNITNKNTNAGVSTANNSVVDVKPIEDRLAALEAQLKNSNQTPAKTEKKSETETPKTVVADARETPAWKSIVTDFETGLAQAVAKSGNERVDAFNIILNKAGQDLLAIHTTMGNNTPNTVEKSSAEIAEIVNRAVDEKMAPINAQLQVIQNMIGGLSVGKSNSQQPVQMEVPKMKSIVMPTGVPNNQGKGMSISEIATRTTFGK